MIITPALMTRLTESGIAWQYSGAFQLPDHTILEPPLSLKRMQAVYLLEMGAFSFAESGFFFGAKIGRYCSIGEGVQLGRGSHPIDWGSTSPLFYQPHRAVFDLDLPRAADFRINPKRPPLFPKVTAIGNDVRIGAGALISQGVTIHDGAVVEPRAVVTKDVPPFAIVAGNPATVAATRFGNALAARFMQLAWWRFAFWDLPGAPVAQPELFLDMVQSRIAEGMQPYAPAPLVLSQLAKEPQEAL